MSLAFKFFDEKEKENFTEDDANEADDVVKRLKTQIFSSMLSITDKISRSKSK